MANPFRRYSIQLVARKKTNSLSCLQQRRNASTDKNILTSVFKDLPKSNYTINDFVWKNLDKWPDKTLMECAVTGHSYTYAQTHKMSEVLATSLITKLKLKSDDKVAVILPNIPQYPSTLLGVLRAGCVATMMNPAYTVHEFKRQFQLVECKAIISTKLSYPNVKQALDELQVKIPTILIENEGLPEGTIKFSEFAEDFTLNTDCLKSVRRTDNDVAVIPFSSGTTGFPKGVVLDHKSVVAANQAIADPEIVAIMETTNSHQSVFPAVLPFFHIFGFNILLLNQMSFGCKLVTLPYFKPELFVQTIATHKTDVLFLVPPMVVFLGKHPMVTADHLQSVRSIVCGAASVSEDDAAGVINKNKNINFRQGYGLTETNGAFAIGRNTDTNHKSVGHVLANCEVKIADLNTQEALGPGQEGEIWCRGPSVMRGYYNDEEANREVFSEDGWYKTGDIGKYDVNKYMYVTDRLKELIKVKGFQVPPAELEAIIRTHPKILDCAVLGVPDPINGEAPKAFLVPKPGQTIVPDEIKDYVNAKVTSFKNIKQVQIIEAVPKNPAGKILRRELKEKYC